MNARSHSRARGFTLIELVVSMVIAAIVAGFMAMFITAPIDAFFAQSRRAQLTASADAVWQSMDRDLRTALPNNVRQVVNGNFVALELLTVINTGRYRADLTLGAPDNAFTTAGDFANIAGATTFNGPPWLAIVATGVPPNGAYAFGNVMTPNPVDITVTPIAGTQQVTLSQPMTFAGAGSPRRRAYLVSGGVSYLCDLNLRTVTRYSGYAIAAAQPAAPGAFGAGTVSSLLATNVTACTFSVVPGNGDNGGVVSILYTVASQGDTLTLQHEARIENPP
jgi:MSHA biogenesis protein MshO